MIDLRPATLADAEAIRCLVRAAYARWVPVLGREPMPMLADYSKSVECNLFDLHHMREELAALIEMHPASDHLLIVNVAVLPTFQGIGLGRELLAHAERLAASLRLGRTKLYTNKLMAKNVTLYRELGYRVDHEKPFPGGAVVHMSKVL